MPCAAAVPQASDQYLLDGLKRLCEAALAQSLSVENLVDVWQASEAYSAPQLAKRCVLFALEHCTEIIAQDPMVTGGANAGSGSTCGSTPTGSTMVSQASATIQLGGAAAFAELMIRMVPALRSSLLEDLAKAAQQQQNQPQNNQQQQQQQNQQQQNPPGPGGGGGAAAFMQQMLGGQILHHH
jgi:hypothetical protein